MYGTHKQTAIHTHTHTHQETIGDAYMAVSNLVTDQKTDHVIRCALFALRAIEAGKMCVCVCVCVY